VDERLQMLACEAIQISPADFAATSGLRTLKEQQLLFKQERSKCDGINKISKHQIGKAIDICPMTNGKLDYNAESDLFFTIGLFYYIDNLRKPYQPQSCQPRPRRAPPFPRRFVDIFILQ
jgi:hypothetical protein